MTVLAVRCIQLLSLEMAWSSSKAASALRRQSVDHPTPSFVPIDNWEGSLPRPDVNAAVLRQPVISEGPPRSLDRSTPGTSCLLLCLLCDILDVCSSAHSTLRSKQGLCFSFPVRFPGGKARIGSDRHASGGHRSPSGLFKPGRRSGVPAVLPTPSAAMSSQSIDLQASVKALAQQAKQEQAKQQQAASQADAKLEKLKGLLQRELALQVLSRQML